jgi:hypothetical protein
LRLKIRVNAQVHATQSVLEKKIDAIIRRVSLCPGSVDATENHHRGDHHR